MAHDDLGIAEADPPSLADEPEKSARGPAARVAAFTGRHRRAIAAVWIALLVVAAPFAATIMSVLSGGGWDAPGSQSAEAARVLSDANLNGRGKLTAALVIRDRDYAVADKEFDTRVRHAIEVATTDKDLPVSSVYGWSTLDRGTRDEFLGKDRHTIVDSIGIDLDGGTARNVLPGVQNRLTDAFADDGLDVSIVSQDAFFGALNKASQDDLILAELITFPLIALILIVLFRSVAAVAASMAVGVTTIVLTLGVLSPIAHATELSLFLANTATMLGLGVGIDYSLFVIARYQEELARGREVGEAVAVAVRRSGHTILFSGTIVLACTATLLFIHLNIVLSLAVGAMTAVAISMLVCTLLLPTLLHIIGKRINWGRPRFLPGRSAIGGVTAPSGRWRRFALAVMRRPIVFGLLGVVFMGVLSYPAMGLKTFTPDVGVLPASDPSRQGFEIMSEQLGVGVPSPVRVVVTSPTSLATDPAAGGEFVHLVDELGSIPHVERTLSYVNVLRQVAGDPVAAGRTFADGGYSKDVRQSVQYFLSKDGRTGVIELRTDSSAGGDGSHEVVNAARQVIDHRQGSALHVVVGGESAEGLDANVLFEQNLPKIIIAMLVVIFVVLMVTFRSILLPIKAIALNVLSIGATFGIMVLVFQHGFGTGLLGLHHTGYMQNFVPILMLAILFSLSTDYEVFLLNRIRESYIRTGDNTGAVAEGVQATGPLISGAAILMMAVFGAFAFTGVVPIEQLGFGMALGVLIDATVVRLILVPAAMRLMGKWNWWFPGRPDISRGAVESESHS
ncbi:MMPL family protein [Nocardia nova SH22a]|uniref:MMPL family protein n=1 Tax=Nocardia nova SH22a TaxID=1415166 RepID=W5T917_9NOCA|nr:MMPL family transporter [Nocardia nova]AHH15458.1 MMPL family protein [Nocardia nova SH22a]